VIGDENTILWGLGLYTGVGSIFESVDEQGRAVRFKVVALLKNSILQGALLVNRRNFDRLYPAESGYSLFMIDVPSADYGIQEQLLGNFTDFGVELEDSGDRLRNFLKIESTYLVIFQMLGGLGLMLGAFGFGFLILRNVQDRAGELATMQALGFKIKDLRSLLFKEHVILLLWSVICGAGCALISWVPLLKQGADLPFGRVIVILALILLVGIASCLISVGSVFKGSFLNILKSE
jgi:ABC-type antimicrobial peptide transport system permease subunit